MNLANASGFVPARLREAAPRLARDDVHLWWLPYRRAERRDPLKAVLGAYLGTHARDVALFDDVHGRPHLAASCALDFNWSHSGDHALVVVARDLPALGVDIEQPRPRPRALALAERFFASDEHALLEALPVTQRDEAFMRLWTAKEAALKAHGRGIAYGLERVAFTLRDGEAWPARFEGAIGAVGEWQFHALAPQAGFIGMAAWRGAARTLRCFALAGSDAD